MIKLDVENQVARVTLSRPEKQNALSLNMFIQMDQIIKKIKKDRKIRAVILQGEGQHFCSGLDVKSVMSKPTGIIKLLLKWLPGNANLVQRVVLGWQDLPIPVIALMQGNCLGGGLHIALGADYRIATPDIQCAIMESKWGLCPDMGSSALLLGSSTADHIYLIASTGKPVGAQAAKDIGLVSEIHDNPEQRIQTLLTELMQRSPDALAAIKRVKQSAYNHNRRKILATETWSQIRLLLNSNTKIAMHNALKEDKKNYKPRSGW